MPPLRDESANQRRHHRLRFASDSRAGSPGRLAVFTRWTLPSLQLFWQKRRKLRKPASSNSTRRATILMAPTPTRSGLARDTRILQTSNERRQHDGMHRQSSRATRTHPGGERLVRDDSSTSLQSTPFRAKAFAIRSGRNSWLPRAAKRIAPWRSAWDEPKRGILETNHEQGRILEVNHEEDRTFCK